MDKNKNPLAEIDELLAMDRPDIKGELSENVKRYRQLTSGDDEDFKGSPMLTRIMEFIDKQYPESEPPVKMVRDLLTAYEKRKTRINQEIIDTMVGYGQVSASFDDGTEVVIDDKISVKVNNEDRFYDWVIKSGYEDAIKHTLIFSKGDYNNDVKEAIHNTGILPKVKYGIAPQTRDKLIRDTIKSNNEDVSNGLTPQIQLPPDDVVMVNVFSVAKITTKTVTKNSSKNDDMYF